MVIVMTNRHLRKLESCEIVCVIVYYYNHGDTSNHLFTKSNQVVVVLANFDSTIIVTRCL